MDELKRLLEEQVKAFEEFKKANDKRIEEIAARGQASSDTEAKVAAIEADLQKIGGAITELQATLNAMRVLGQGDKKSMKSQDEIEYEKNFSAYLRKGNIPEVVRSLTDLSVKAMSISVEPDGGFWVTPDMSGRIVQKIFESSPIRSIASVQTIGTDALEGSIDNEEADAGWVGETGARTATATPKIGKWRIPVHEMYAMPETSQQLLDDTSVNVEAWLEGKVASKFARLESTAFVTGDGVSKPRGFLSYPTEATGDSSRTWGNLEHVATGTSGGFGADPNGSDKLIDLVHRLKTAYRSRAVWVMNRATVGAVRRLKTSQGDYVWLPSMVATQPATLLGYPVIEAEDMPSIAANSLSIAFGDFSAGYQIVDRQGIRVLRDPFTNKPWVRFYSTRRVGGGVLDFDAIKFLKFSVS